MEIRRLAPSELDSFLRFMDGPAFQTNPQWAGCYCQFYLNSAVENAELDAEKTTKPARNRAAACTRVTSGTMNGYLAMHDGEVVAWMAANSAGNLVQLPAPVTEEKLARIICFTVAPEWQGKGLSKALISYALADLPKLGYTVVEAAPLAADTHQSWGYRGKLSTYLKLGFTLGPFIDDKHRLVTRRL